MLIYGTPLTLVVVLRYYSESVILESSVQASRLDLTKDSRTIDFRLGLLVGYSFTLE